MEAIMKQLYVAQDATTEAEHALRRATESLSAYLNLTHPHNGLDRVMAFNEAKQLINEVLIWLRQQPGDLQHATAMGRP